MTRHLRAVAAVSLGLTLVGTSTAAAATPSRSEPDGKGTVYAATSLPAAFRKIAKGFRADNPDVKVRFKFRASGDLAEQIQNGASADVFAPADQGAMSEVADEISGTSTVFARNQLEIAVQEGNPKGIQTLADLAKPDVRVALCSADTGCGQYSNRALQEAGVEVTPTSRKPDVARTLAEVQNGDADAAIVYVTDVKSADRVTGVPIPANENVIGSYPIAVVKGSDNPRAAKAFVAYVLSDEGQATLREFGFLAP